MWLMFLRKPFPDAMHFIASDARHATMFLCHLSDELGGKGHLTADMALPPSMANELNKEIIREQGWVVSSEHFDTSSFLDWRFLWHISDLLWPENWLIITHTSIWQREGDKEKTWTTTSWNPENKGSHTAEVLLCHCLTAWHNYLWHCRDHRGFETKDGATKFPGLRTPLSNESAG